MKRWTTLGLALTLILALTGCNKYAQGRQNTPLNSPENIDKVSQIPGDDNLANTISNSDNEENLITDVYQQNLNLQTLQDLVDRYGEDLNWDDFASYYSEDVGSGLYIYRYPIDWDYCLLIGGSSLELPPMYIRLVSEYNAESYIDVRYEDIDNFIDSIPKTSEFSYDEVLATYKENDPGVKSNGFHNTSRAALETISDVLGQAKNECTIAYDTVDISYDSTTSIWEIAFYTEGSAGGGQTVYMDSYGVTCLLVYGE